MGLAVHHETARVVLMSQGRGQRLGGCVMGEYLDGGSGPKIGTCGAAAKVYRVTVTFDVLATDEQDAVAAVQVAVDDMAAWNDRPEGSDLVDRVIRSVV